MVDRLPGVDVQVGDATVARVHMVVVVMMCCMPLTQVSMHVQVMMGRRAQNVGIFLCQLVDPLLRTCYRRARLGRSPRVVDHVRRTGSNEMRGGVILLVVGATRTPCVVVMVVVVVG